MFKKIKEFILDIFFPIECLGCGLSNVWMCENCFQGLPLNKSFFETTDFFPSYLDGFFIASDWESKLLQKAIHSYKYNFIKELANFLARLMIIKFNYLLTIYPELKQAIILPVPLHKKRKSWRGFNQAELLAKVLANNFAMQMETDVLKRIKNIKPQVNLKSFEREKNISGAFGVTGIVKSKMFLLIDDVMTTGSTMNECARVLKSVGAEKIYGLAVARG